MPTLSVGTTNRTTLNSRGVTLLELLIVVTLIALVAGLSFPSLSAGLDTLRLRSTSDAMISFLNTALSRADRRQQVVEIRISPRENAMMARSADLGFVRRFDLPEPIHIAAVLPAAEVNPDEPRRFLVYPGGSVPAISIQIVNREGRHRTVSIDPITGVPRAQ